ncbi:MAG: ROK family transcriptional regulator [Microbacteriaceae bacterium]|nr:ROK family transcriptional regulator [Microbacteriaceae bacterium]
MTIESATWTAGPAAARDVALEVLLHGPISRSEIARRLKLSAGSLTRLSTPLIEDGLLVETGEYQDGRAGRPSRPLDIKPDSRHFLGMKLTGESLQGVVTDLRATVLHSISQALPSRAPDDVADAIAALVSELLEVAPDATALGIGLGGRIAEDGTVRSAPFLDWADVPLRHMVESRCNLPTVVQNDVIAFTEAEHWFGAGRGLERFAVVTLGAGAGYGLVEHDAIVSNDDAGIGLVGHWPLDPLGPLCPAGHRGCAHSVLTQSAIVSAVSSGIGREVDYAEAMSLAEAGDPVARRVVDDAGLGLGRLLAAIANLTMPQRIVLGGEGVQLFDVAADAVHAGIRRDRDPRAADIDLVTTPGDDLEWCRGAAVIAIQTYVLGTAV